MWRSSNVCGMHWMSAMVFLIQIVPGEVKKKGVFIINGNNTENDVDYTSRKRYNNRGMVCPFGISLLKRSAVDS